MSSKTSIAKKWPGTRLLKPVSSGWGHSNEAGNEEAHEGKLESPKAACREPPTQPSSPADNLSSLSSGRPKHLTPDVPLRLHVTICRLHRNLPLHLFSDYRPCVSIPANPQSHLSHWVELRPINSDKHTIPDVALEPVYLYMAPHPSESVNRIPEQTPEPQSPWIELHPIDIYGHDIPGVTLDLTFLNFGLHGFEEDAESIPDKIPKLQSHRIDLCPIDEYPRPIPKILLEPLSLLLDLLPLED
ncbi:hypothetical protein FIBSPDRAFT_900180 [Athelia psychrophila]|uniref:Uncharacterized protein n=1 Tax=Athelia psychrophila TaxID=1759441 RepID=A0A165YRP8_9AGAM|nr:hypothetical protein FIBSPDRAFT_900180 [Fibularhizoctonia sp. CBS 109695]